MVRLNDELNSAMKEGSLYKPLGSHNIKQDPEARLKQRRESQGLKIAS